VTVENTQSAPATLEPLVDSDLSDLKFKMLSNLGTALEKILEVVGCTEDDFRTLPLKDVKMVDLHTFLEHAE
jgi:hypothetical protein